MAKQYCEVSGVELPNKKIKFEWEDLKQGALRAKVIGGWVLRSWGAYEESGSVSEAMVFISDPNHEWEVEL